jgi:ribonuclease HI
LEYAIQHGPKALKVISDSELLVRQIKGIYKMKNATLQELHGRAKELIAQLDWTAWRMRPWTKARGEA